MAQMPRKNVTLEIDATLDCDFETQKHKYETLEQKMS